MPRGPGAPIGRARAIKPAFNTYAVLSFWTMNLPSAELALIVTDVQNARFATRELLR